MSTDVLEKPDLEETVNPDDLIHKCCGLCWELPGPAEAYCGVFKEWTDWVRARPDQVCAECKKPEVQARHQHKPWV